MSLVQACLVLLAGLAGGTINAVVGSGSLITFPTLLAFGYPPVLLSVSLVLVVLQPRMQRALVERRARPGHVAGRSVGATAMTGVGLAGVYGGYFGGAQGVLLVGLLGSVLPESLQRVNALKNALATCVNAVAAVVFVAVAPQQVDWAVVALIAAGSAAGGLIGARLGRRLPQPVLRAVIMVVGLVAIAFLASP